MVVTVLAMVMNLVLVMVSGLVLVLVMELTMGTALDNESQNHE